MTDPFAGKDDVEKALQRPGYQIKVAQAWEAEPGHHELIVASAPDDLVAFVDALVNPVLGKELGEAPSGGGLLPMVANEYFHVDGDGLTEPVRLDLDGEDQSMVGAVLSAVGVDIEVRAEQTEVAGRHVRLLHAKPTDDLPKMSQRLRDQAMRGLHQFMHGLGV